MLAERELTLSTVECAIDGIVSRRIFATNNGPDVLGDSVIVDTVEDAIDLLDLPRPQFKKASGFSAKAARAAAREGRDLLGVSWCLAVWAMPLPADAETIQETVHLALNTGRDVSDQTVNYDGPADAMGDWLAEQALQMVRRAL
jgi:nicotinamide mononucleotide (NMN) deamidase PncC